MIAIECGGSVGAKGIEPAQGVLEENPLFLLCAHVFGTVTLYVCESLAGGRLNPDVVIGRQLMVEPAGNNRVLQRECVGNAGSQFSDGVVSMRSDGSRSVSEKGPQLHCTGDYGIVGQELRRIVGNRLDIGLPSKEVLREKISGGVG